MKSVMSLRSDGGTGWAVKVRLGNPVKVVETLGFSWQPEKRVFATDDASIALALLDSPDVVLLVERDVADAIRIRASAISVTAADAETPVKGKRGRPPKAEGAMTAAERARRYRRKHKPSWQMRRVDLSRVTFAHVERLVSETGYSVDQVIYFAVNAASPDLWESLKAARLPVDGLRVQADSS